VPTIVEPVLELIATDIIINCTFAYTAHDRFFWREIRHAVLHRRKD